jgi:glycosyltransferase involved in cell wall biosynthesis
VKVSIAMATYNGADYLQEQLDSFVAQTHHPDELVVCDDGSDDDTFRILNNFSKIAPFEVIVFNNKKNLGYTQNFAKALSICSGDLIFLSDQDDVWFNDKIARVLAIAAEFPDGWLLTHDGQLVDEALRPTELTKLGQVRSGYGVSKALSTGALSIVRRELLALALPIPSQVIGHDNWLYRVCGTFPTRRIQVDDCLQSIRRHNSNTSEWVVNSRQKIGPIDVFKTQLRTRAAQDYNDRIYINRALYARVEEFKLTSIYKRDRSSAENFLEELHRERRALIARQRLVESGPVNRRLHAFAMLIRRDYALFNGLRSFFRDILR